ncbi:MAG: flagellar biosynthesis anti-sigma factor FlgM [Pseudobdellovibrio sp.]
MKITHNKIGQNLNLADTSKADKSKKADGTANANDASKSMGLANSPEMGSVKVDLSTRAKDIQHAKEIAMASPDVDLAKVEKFQKLIDGGNYKIDSKAIAERMVDEHLLAAGKTNNE